MTRRSGTCPPAVSGSTASRRPSSLMHSSWRVGANVYACYPKHAPHTRANANSRRHASLALIGRLGLALCTLPPLQALKSAPSGPTWAPSSLVPSLPATLAPGPPPPPRLLPRSVRAHGKKLAANSPHEPRPWQSPPAPKGAAPRLGTPTLSPSFPTPPTLPSQGPPNSATSRTTSPLPCG